jgi:hypothetical protein
MSADGPRNGAAEPAFGPSLPQLLGPRWRALARWQQILLAIGAIALLAALAATLVRSAVETKSYHQSSGDATSRGLAPIPFHFDHSRKLRISKPPGAYVKAERSVGDTLAASFTVSPLRLGSQPGLVSGFMPIVATAHERAAARRYEGFRLAFEGRARVNEVEGYQFAFTARLVRPGQPARQLFGRVVLLPEPFDAEDPGKAYPAGKRPTRGLVITMLSTSLDNVPSATRVGDEGILQKPYRSFRFGDG